MRSLLSYVLCLFTVAPIAQCGGYQISVSSAAGEAVRRDDGDKTPIATGKVLPPGTCPEAGGCQNGGQVPVATTE